jgi:hypothetical protein
LTWREDTVSVAPGLEKVARRFERQGAWRTSGWSPIGIGLRRAAGEPDSLPFETLSVRSEWMAPGDRIQILTPADTVGPRLWIVPLTMAATGKPESNSERQRLAQRETFVHANGARRITAVKVLAPERGLTAATQLVARYSPVTFARAEDWLVEVTFDGGKKGTTQDLRPELPLVVHF